MQATIHYQDLPIVPTRLLREGLASRGAECPDDHAGAVRAYAGMLYDTLGPFDLLDEANRVVREATRDEAIESATTPEGWIEIDGSKYYVCP